MRLEKIRLAGFKSFVDPTTVRFPSNLVGVVGPNGCGKSNVIDAVRWVMGESSAKMLRGESMADVIFNGSTGRKPVGTASIELVFDNSDGAAGGAYARFSQIVVRRQVSRDGQSLYSMNGTRCRRRDIQDLFLGTGLGPRSYAIIEQGMISRIIEARPDELRLFIEEAAGISKYKERRRETEARMRQTRENLDRLDDVRQEVAKQLQHLERQATTAERFTQLKAEERRLELELKVLRWQALDQAIGTERQSLLEAETHAEGELARLRRLEAQIESRRADYQTATESFNRIQGQFYAVGSEIARAEQALQFASEARGRREGELVRLDQELSEADDHLRRDDERLAEIDARLSRDEPQLREADAALIDALGALAGGERALRDWEQGWDAFNRAAAAPAEQAQAERARINALERAMERDRERQRRLDEEAGRLEELDLVARIVPLEKRDALLESRVEELGERREGYALALAEQDATIAHLGAELDGVRTAMQRAQGRLASLTALQEEALATAAGAQTEWLDRVGLHGLPRLIDGVEVAPGWERALEALLGDWIGALVVPDLDRLVGGLAEPSAELPAGLLLLEDAAGGGGTDTMLTGDAADRHREEVRWRAPWAIEPLVGHAQAVAGVRDALSMRANLSDTQQLVTVAGVRVGRTWLMTPKSEKTEGVIARAEALKVLQAQMEELREREQALAADLDASRAERVGIQDEQAGAEQRLGQLIRELSQLKSDLTGLRTRREHQQERVQSLSEERGELADQIASSLDALGEARERLHDLLGEVEAMAERRDALSVEREALRAALAAGREQERRCRERTQGLKVSVESNRAARSATEQSLARTQERRALLHERRVELLDALEEDIEPLAEQRARLDAQLVVRVEVEQTLAEARARLTALDAEIRDLEQERHRVEQGLQASQRELERLRLVHQERLVRRQTLAEQIGESGQRPSDVLARMDAAASEPAWQEALDKILARLQRLGPVNLAAVDEYRQQSERKTYLDAQFDDIYRSLETLEQAIRKIDRETRSRFRDTYERVAQGFQQLFPRLFGGGQASLDLTDEDLLETGVTVMARPPGKRNSSIHLLSGGEKALTAVALIFAIFELNPAPFCMLDEVDAPLDDANVGRFCDLVSSMSDRVQFVFISHNKLTMEIADHLLGVTMHEPGVSRLVSVDVEEAVRLAAVS